MGKISLPKMTLIKPGSKMDSKLNKWFTTDHFTYNKSFGMLVPLILDQFFIFFLSMLTNSLISSSGEDSVAAVSLVGPITMVLLAVFFAVSNGGTVIVAQYKGKGDEQKVRHAAGQVIMMTVVVATVSAVLLMIFSGLLVDTLYADADIIVREKAKNYLIGYCFSVPTFAIFNSIFNVLRGIGETKLCLRLTIVINVVHLIASVIFINFLKLDIMGTALSFNLARIIGAIMAIIVICQPSCPLTVRLKDVFSFNGLIQKAVIRMGIPFAMEQIFFNLGFMLCTVYMTGLGQAVIAGNSISSSVFNVYLAAGCGVMTLAITVVGRCIGAGDKESARKYGKSLIGLSIVTSALLILILFPMSPLILKLFHPEPTTLPLVQQALLIGAISAPILWSFSNIVPSTLRAAGDANFTSIVSLITMWIVRVAGGYLFAIVLGMGLNGVWVSMALEWAVRGVIFYARFKGKKWLNKKVV